MTGGPGPDGPIQFSVEPNVSDQLPAKSHFRQLRLVSYNPVEAAPFCGNYAKVLGAPASR